MHYSTKGHIGSSKICFCFIPSIHMYEKLITEIDAEPFDVGPLSLHVRPLNLHVTAC